MQVSRRIKSKFGKRVCSGDNHWQLIDLNDYVFDKPCVICLSGNGSVLDKYANGLCKRSEKFLELLLNKSNNSNLHVEDFVDIIGCTYGHKTTISADHFSTAEILKLREDERSFCEFIDNNPNAVSRGYGYLDVAELNLIIDKILMPCCFDKDKKKRPLDEACRRISNITFFTWCHGSVEVTRILELFYQKCMLLGFQENEIIELLSCLSQITYAPQTSINYLPTISFESLSDYNNQLLDQLYPKLKGIVIELEKGEKFSTFFDTLNVISKKLTNSHGVYVDEHDIGILDRDENWDLKKHKNANAMSQLISWALCRSVENSLKNYNSNHHIPKMSLENLKPELEDILASFTADDLQIGR